MFICQLILDSISVIYLNMKHEKTYTLDELSSLTAVPKRTIRFYVQSGLVPKPEGANRGAYYLKSHLDRLLEIQKWRNAGISLKRIGELLSTPDVSAIPDKLPKPGDLSVRSHIFLHRGVELVIDPAASELSSADVAQLVRHMLNFFSSQEDIEVQTEGETEDEQ